MRNGSLNSRLEQRAKRADRYGSRPYRVGAKIECLACGAHTYKSAYSICGSASLKTMRVRSGLGPMSRGCDEVAARSAATTGLVAVEQTHITVIARAAAVAVIAIGLLVLAGSALDLSFLKGPVPSFARRTSRWGRE